MKAKPKPVTKSFKATLERMQSNLGWVIIRIPFDVSKVWGVRGRLRVKGEINGFAFRTALFPTGRGYHFLLVNKRMQSGANARAGIVAQFQLEPDTEERKAILPLELKRFLDEDRLLRRWFERLNYSMRKWMGDQITQVKNAESRMRRAEQIAEILLATMEAEQELPPILKAAFARDPRAFEGWQRMSSIRQRGQLLSIFHYRSPESRDRRVAKLMEEAAALAAKPVRTKRK
jgi:uncharacterized protein YdeI (YjbR/CyaY-like superfamily)